MSTREAPPPMGTPAPTTTSHVPPIGSHADEIITPAGMAIPERNSIGARYEFLDALRGVAAMLVVIEHIFEIYFHEFGEWTLTHFRLGEFGVTVFFMVSGYIIPASLERRGSLKEFWIGRFFRLFPIYWLCLAAMLVLYYVFDAYRGYSAEFLDRPRFNSLVNMTMVQNFTSTPLAMGQSWTLAYEMAFYVIVCVLFVAGWHKKPLGFAVIGLGISMVIGNPIGSSPLSNMTPTRLLLCLALVGAGVLAAFYLTWHRGLRIAIVCAAILGIVMVGLFNRNEAMYSTAFFLGTMFFGNCLYRWSSGILSTRALLLLTILAFFAIVIAQEHDWSPWLHSVPEINGAFHLSEVLTFGGAYAVFLGLFLFREYSFPRPLLWLGRVSYSLYLVHSVLLYTIPPIDGQPLLTCLMLVAVTLVVSGLTYRFVEKPSIDLGRMVIKRLRKKPAAAPTTAASV